MLFPIGKHMARKTRPVTTTEQASTPANSFPERGTDVGAFVRARREAHGMSLRQLAELAGVGVRFLLELEHGKATARMESVNAVLAVFGKRLGVVERERE